LLLCLGAWPIRDRYGLVEIRGPNPIKIIGEDFLELKRRDVK
jgi:hypothetical protein